MPLDPEVPPPPEEPEALLAWAEAHDVLPRLDDVLIGDGPRGAVLPGRDGEALTYRQILLERAGGAARLGGRHDADETARRYLHRIACLVAARREARAWLDEHGRDPEEGPLVAFLGRLRAAARALRGRADFAPRPDGTFEPLGVRLVREPTPTLIYEEAPLVGAASARGPEETALPLLGVADGPLRFVLLRGARPAGEAPAEQQRAAIEALVELLRDPRRAGEQELVADLLATPAWRHALGALDEALAKLGARGAAGPEARAPDERIAFRVVALGDGGLHVEPLVQKRGRGGAFSKGARLPWWELPAQRALTDADRRAFQAYDDRFARTGLSTSNSTSTLGSPSASAPGASGFGGALSPAQLFGVLRALVDHPAVFLDGPGDRGGRLDLRQGHLRLRFASAADGSLAPQFELLGLPLLAPDVAQALRDDRHLVLLHRPDGAAPHVLLAKITPQAAALVRALAAAPARFPPEAHDALAARLEALQDAVDVEFPSQWTRTIAPADGRPVVRLELLASGAVAVGLAARPVKLGPTFAPGEGPALVLEGQGRDRHGARRDLPAERQAAHALAERLSLGAADPLEPWRWRVPEGDPALHLVATLEAMTGEVVVEWADDARWLGLGTIGRRHVRLAVADRKDWFSVEGGAAIAGEIVPLAALLAAIREDRRYVPVGARGFVRIEESLREALARAESALSPRGAAFGVTAVGSEPLLGLVEEEAQIDADVAFRAVVRRMREGAAVAPILPTALAAALRPYQRAGVEWLVRLAHWGAGAVLADEMGLGKTVQTLAVLAHRAPLGPALVVAPTSVVANWVGEAARFVPEMRVRIYRGAERAAALRGLGPGDLVVTSYALATLDAEALAPISFASLVLDEAQAVKNAATQRARALQTIDAGWRLALTGTPIENALGELWSLMRVVSPGLLGSWEQFRGRYAVPIEKFGDDARRKALAALLRPYVLRRTKAEVARELPPRTELVRVVRLSDEEQALYEELRASTLDEIERAKRDPDRDAQDLRFVLLAALTRLRQLCCHPRLVYPRAHAGSTKAAYLLDLLAELRDGGHKALVFSQFRGFLDLLAPRLRQHGFRALSLDGTTPAEVRQARIEAFQRGEADVFLISLKAGGVGLNLTTADTVVHLDPWWNPAVEDQATARAHRIGQRKPVTAIRLVAAGTIEEAVLGLHAGKRALAAAILEGSALAATLSTDELVALIGRGAAGAGA